VSDAAPDPEFEALLAYVRENRGFDYTGYKRPSLLRRFAKRAESVGASGWAEYRAVLERDAAEYEALFDTILINVTSFFRDASTWDFVREDVIPRILEQRPTGAIRVWSAGCASGEEAYTLAILFAEALGADAFRDRVKIYATDVDEDALAEARQAVYTAKQLEAVPEALREAYFQPVPPGKFAFRHDIRRCVIFGRNELLNDPPISRVDLLVSRNTLMYFGREAQQRILSNYYFALAPDGFLVVGKAEALQSRSDLFEPYDLKRRIFVKTIGAEIAPRRAVRTPPVDAEGNGHAENGSALRQASFEQAPAAEIVVDTANEIAAINRAARSLFGLSPQDIGRPLRDLEVSYRPLELRSLIDQVQTARSAVTARDVNWTVAGGERRILDVQVTPLVTSTGDFAGASVTFVDMTRYRSLQDELEQTRRDLETAYEELQSTVEELETTNEELQSTNEELETMNEELQSTNEELETMNEELQSTNEELETINDELRDRTDEALHVNAFVTSVLKNIPQAVIVVDRELRVSSWSENAADAWGLREAEVRGANFLNLDIGLPVAALRDPIRSTLAGEDAEPVVLPGHNRRGQAVVCTVGFAQLRKHDGSVIGAILLVDAARDDDA
jgi:two-component system, chemotaxis family, CheB/CheR fusion protein